MSLPHHRPVHLSAVPTVPPVRLEVEPPSASMTDVARVLHLDLSHAHRAMELWSDVLGVPVEQLSRLVVDRALAGADPGPPAWVLGRTRRPVVRGPGG
ncbi:MAG: hypothetical protein Q7T56_02670 [Nocardioidaceae bacterium]|nr:hypothetical protein [Nocardioidaceae bacterium]